MVNPPVPKGKPIERPPFNSPAGRKLRERARNDKPELPKKAPRS